MGVSGRSPRVLLGFRAEALLIGIGLWGRVYEGLTKGRTLSEVEGMVFFWRPFNGMAFRV